MRRRPTVLLLGLAVLGMTLELALPRQAASQTVSAAAAHLPQTIRDRGELRIGTAPTYPPLESRDPATNTLQGLDIDLGNAIATRLGLKPVWMDQSFQQLIPSLDTGRIDIGASGMTDIPARREKTDFVDYFATGVQLFTLAPAPPDLQKVEDVCGRKVAVNRNGIFFVRMQEFSEQICVAKGRKPVDLVLTDLTSDGRRQMAEGRAVAAAQGVDAIRYLNETADSPERGKYALIGAPISVDLAGFGVAKSQPALRDVIASVVQEMIADGSYDTIFRKWALPYTEVKQVTINAGGAGTP
ncbi:MAG: ABC transporter substrate-binding protein [Acidisphaera sp.]|nr:ABC transporter substrate-binding protein [Acidisphaera sp.]